MATPAVFTHENIYIWVEEQPAPLYNEGNLEGRNVSDSHQSLPSTDLSLLRKESTPNADPLL